MTNNFEPRNSFVSMIPENFSFTKDFESFFNQFRDFYLKVSKASNAKDIGMYELTEVICGQKFFKAPAAGTPPDVKNQIFRKVIECGTLPKIASITIPHNISGVNNNWMFTRIYGAARRPGAIGLLPYFIPIPNSSPDYQVELMVDNTNINITTGNDLSDYTYSVVILEYWKG